jgi:hypothetical protein
MFKEIIKKKISIPEYKLISNISKDIRKEAAKYWGDLMHIIPLNDTHTLEEICVLVWVYEKRHPEKSQNRTRKQITEGISKLVEYEILVLK